MNNHNLFPEIKNKLCPLLIVQVLAIFDNTFRYWATFRKSQNVALPYWKCGCSVPNYSVLTKEV